MRDPNPPSPARTVEELIGYDAALDIAIKYGLHPPVDDQQRETMKQEMRQQMPQWIVA